MYQLISRLIVRNRELLKAENLADDSEVRAALTTQTIAKNALLRLTMESANAAMPLQVVVVGPTQVGKSTVTNLLLQQSLAESSAEAGFTVHCQGFHVVDKPQDRYSGTAHWAAEYFGELRQSKQAALDRQVLGEYSLQETTSANTSLLNTVVWDTPDFDSIRSFDYSTPLIKAVAVADLIVFVVSKEKYADKTVWTMLKFLHSLNVKVVLVMNKTPKGVRDELADSLRNKYQAALPGSAFPPLCFIGEYKSVAPALMDSDELNALEKSVADNLHSAEPGELKDNALGFIKQHWNGWTENVGAEHRLQGEYKKLVEKVTTDTLARYRSEYIDSDRHQEVMQLALSELLVLLEVPGMAKPLSKIRSVVTWPLRTLISSAKEPSPVAKDDRNEERRLLDELGKHALATLNTSIAQKESGPNGDWWQHRRAEVTQAEYAINHGLDKSLDNYQTLLQVEIDRAAQSLYKNLQTQPATLNSLRAARVTADAAAVVLAVKSGGLGAVDLVVAPAMLSLTTLLTEGALGKYMQRVQKNLTAYQEKEVHSVIDRKLTKPLLQLVQNNKSSESITEADLQQITAKLEAYDVRDVHDA